MSETHVEPAKLRTCAGKLDALADRGDTVRGKAVDADVDQILWGLLGHAMWMLPLTYATLNESINDHLAAMCEGLRGSAHRLRINADNYEAADAANADHLNGLGGRAAGGQY